MLLVCELTGFFEIDNRKKQLSLFNKLQSQSGMQANILNLRI